MGLFDSIKKKKAEAERKKEDAKRNPFLEKDEQEKEQYINMSCQEANLLFRDSISYERYCDRTPGVDFSMYMWLKYSYDAPKGLNIQKKEFRIPTPRKNQNSYLWRGFFDSIRQCDFIIDSCLRYGIDKEKNPYLNINYDGIFAYRIPKYFDIVEVLLKPFESDNEWADWLFDRSFYEEFFTDHFYPSERDYIEVNDEYKEKYGIDIEKAIVTKSLAMIMLSTIDFTQKYGIPEDINPIEVFKRNGKYVEFGEMLNIIDSLQTVVIYGRASKEIMSYENVSYYVWTVQNHQKGY